MPKCNFNKFARQLHCSHTSTWAFPANLQHFFKKTLFKSTYGGLLVKFYIFNKFIL